MGPQLCTARRCCTARPANGKLWVASMGISGPAIVHGTALHCCTARRAYGNLCWLLLRRGTIRASIGHGALLDEKMASGKQIHLLDTAELQNKRMARTAGGWWAESLEGPLLCTAHGKLCWEVGRGTCGPAIVHGEALLDERIAKIAGWSPDS